MRDPARFMRTAIGVRAHTLGEYVRYEDYILLRQQLADNQRKLEECSLRLQETENDAELGAAIRPNYELAKKMGISYVKWTVESIDRAIEQSKGGDDD